MHTYIRIHISYHVRYPRNVDASGCHVSAYQDIGPAALEQRQRLPKRVVEIINLHYRHIYTYIHKLKVLMA